MTSSSLPPTFGRYQVLSLLGKGAVGEVYLADDPALSRKVAVKILSGLDALPAAEQGETRERFLREARAAAGLSHPNIVTIFDVGEHEGMPYIAMEYLRGTTLDRHAREGHLLPAQKVLEVGIQAALALDEAHRAAIIHRDIKPANMVLIADGSLKVADFGLAKDVHSSLTSTQTLLGTPNYMSPEQIAGRPVDGRSDLFSLAVTLFELLAGERPFQGDTVSSVLYRIVNEPATPLGKLRGDLPQELANFFDAALSKNPNERPQTGNAFAKALHGILAGMGGVPPNLQIPPPAKREGGIASSTLRGEPQSAAPAPPRSRKLRRTLVSLFVLLLLTASAWTLPLWLGAGVDPLGSHRREVEDWLSAKLGAVGDALRITAPEILIPVLTHPAQLSVRVLDDGLEIDAAGRLHLPGDRGAPVRLEIVDACFEGQKTLAPAEFGAQVIVEAEPKVISIPTSSDPGGARITLDGRRLAGKTPTTLDLRACEDHLVELAAPPRQPREITLSKQASREEWAAQLREVDLAPPAVGTLEISAPGKGYAVTIYDRRGRRIGRAGERLRLTPGTHQLVLASKKVLYRKEISVRVRSSEMTREKVIYPTLGKLRVFSIPADAVVRATPASGGPSVELGRTPLTGYSLVAGAVELTVVNPVSGAEYRETVVVRGGSKSTDLRVGKGAWQ